MTIRGYHLLLDGRDVICHAGDIERWLREAVRITGLTPIAELIDEAHGQGIIVIAESHVSLEVRGSVAFADIFSCDALGWWHRLRARRLSERIFGGMWQTRYLQRSIRPPARSSGVLH
ncbi:MAG: hypothetical protein A2V88_08805 [Elusimicrobia bacterium RBG_16_66_12]|nr:MAG: hypothetical protein A2V88_08805 [Elusimicrobia bacterium RBG_16_66_12]